MAHSSPPPAPGAGKPQSLAEAYTICTPLLMGALGRMARMGYRVNPAEGLDLVHDFFVEALPGVLDRFDPRQARFTTYVYAAFVRFARPRIVRTLRWQKVTQDLDRLPAVALAARQEESEPFAEALTHSLSAAYAHLPADLRRILAVRIVEGASEREAARTLKLSRYLLRQRSAEALGRLAVAIGSEDRIPAPVRPMALRLWRDGRTLMDVARELGLSRQQAHAAHRQLLASIGSALLAEGTPAARTGADEKTEGKTMLHETWLRVMRNPDDAAALEQVKEHLVELIDHVDACDACRSAAEQSPDAERVYAAIGRLAENVSPEDEETLQAIDWAGAEEDEEISSAVTLALLPALPEHLQDPKVLGEGITPLDMFRAANAVNNMVHGHIVRAQGEPAVLSTDGLLLGDRIAIRPDKLVKEIARHVEVPEATAARLFEWVLDAAASFPRLFLGFRSETDDGQRVMLHLEAPQDDVNLLERWAPESISQREAEVEEAVNALAEAAPALAAAARNPELTREVRQRVAAFAEFTGRALLKVPIGPAPLSPALARPTALVQVVQAAAASADAFRVIKDAAPAPAAEIAKEGLERAEALVQALEHVQIKDEI